jgi:hypothetical protein
MLLLNSKILYFTSFSIIFKKIVLRVFPIFVFVCQCAISFISDSFISGHKQ